MRHIREEDSLADDSALALALLIEGQPGNVELLQRVIGTIAPSSSDAASVKATGEAERELRRYVNETPLPLPAAVWALGKARDRSLAPTFTSILTRALGVHADSLARQALVALTSLPAEVVPADAIRLAAAEGNDEVRDLAKEWLDLSR
jgi:hypothetical protein